MAEMETVGSETKAPDERCRVCLEIHSETMSLYEEIKIEGFQKETLSKILFDCGNVRVDPNDNKPQTICMKCHEKAREAYMFQLMCENTDNILQNEFIDNLFDMYNIGNCRTSDNFEITDKETVNNLSKVITTSEKTTHEKKIQKDISTKISSKSLKIPKQKSTPQKPRNEKRMQKDNLEDSFISILRHTLSNNEITDKNLENPKLPNSSILTQDISDISTTLKSTLDENTTCSICSKKFPNAIRLAFHIRRHKCKFCDYTVKLLGSMEMNKHMVKNHSDRKRFACTECDKRFFNKQRKNLHMLIHSGLKQEICEVCGAAFTLNTSLRRHLMSHTGERPFGCSKCDKRFKTKKLLEFHQAVHTRLRSFACDVCGAAFTTNSTLAKHKITHQPKRHKCSLCDKAFYTKPSLEQHMLVHSGAKNHKCDVCERTFSRKYSLTNHMKVHTGEKPFVCQMCGTAFSQSANLKMHIKKHHQESI